MYHLHVLPMISRDWLEARRAIGRQRRISIRQLLFAVGQRELAMPGLCPRFDHGRLALDDQRTRLGADTAYDQPDYSGGVVCVLGAEGRGLRPRVAAACDALVSLPLRGRIDSLNVGAAAAVLLYEILQRRSGA